MDTDSSRLLNLAERIKNLNAELDKTVIYYRKRAKGAFRLSLFLMASALSASILGAVGGIILELNPRLLGMIALIPSAILLIDTVVQPQARANWNYAKKDAINALRRRLLYELSDPPTLDEVKAISKDWESADAELSKAWHETIRVALSPLIKSNIGYKTKKEL